MGSTATTLDPLIGMHRIPHRDLLLEPLLTLQIQSRGAIHGGRERLAAFLKGLSGALHCRQMPQGLIGRRRCLLGRLHGSLADNIQARH